MPRPQPNQEEPERGRRPQRKSGLNPLIPLLVVVVLVGGGAIAVLGGKPKKEEPKAEVSTKPKPFSDLAPEAPPSKAKGSGSGRKFVADAPEGLANDATWIKACKIAEEGLAFYEEAVKAKNAEDTVTLNAKGAAAREKLNEAVEMTAAWEEELDAKYGDANPEVRRIITERTRWIKPLDWLLKSAGRNKQ